MRLIDADKLLTKAFTFANSNGNAVLIPVSTIDIMKAPTVDAVEVVRCKDCKHYRIYSDFVHDCGREHGMVYVNPDDFCNYAEREDGDWNG